MEEINLKELIDYIKSRIVLILFIILVVVVIGSAYSLFFKVPKYRSATTIVLVSDSGQSTQTTQTDVNLSKSLVPTYSEIVKTDAVIGKVIKNLALDYSVSYLKSNVSVTTINNTEIIKIVVTDKDKALAADIANEIVKVFSSQIKSIYKLQNVSQIDVAAEAGSPYNINIVKDLVIYILIGLVLSFGLVFVIFYFDTTVKSSDEIENKLGLAVMGVIPKVKKDKKK